MVLCSVLVGMCLLYCTGIKRALVFDLPDSVLCTNNWELIVDVQLNRLLSWKDIPEDISKIQVSIVCDMDGECNENQ